MVTNHTWKLDLQFLPVSSASIFRAHQEMLPTARSLRSTPYSLGDGKRALQKAYSLLEVFEYMHKRLIGTDRRLSQASRIVTSASSFDRYCPAKVIQFKLVIASIQHCSVGLSAGLLYREIFWSSTELRAIGFSQLWGTTLPTWLPVDFVILSDKLFNGKTESLIARWARASRQSSIAKVLLSLPNFVHRPVLTAKQPESVGTAAKPVSSLQSTVGTPDGCRRSSSQPYSARSPSRESQVILRARHPRSHDLKTAHTVQSKAFEALCSFGAAESLSFGASRRSQAGSTRTVQTKSTPAPAT